MISFRSCVAAFAIAAVVAQGGCGLVPPALPDYAAPRTSMWLDQGWSARIQNEYHHADQGTLTMGIPYEWFMSLEQPALLSEQPLLSDQAFLNKMGFIPSAGPLPVGFAWSDRFNRPETGDFWKNPASGQPLHGVGLTCAACHTGRMTFNGTEILVDGGSSLLNIQNFRTDTGLAVLYTKLNPARFSRFASRVLGADANGPAKDELYKELAGFLESSQKEVDLTKKTAPASVEEGFGRLDALNRIGNQVFSLDMGVDDNFVATNAPVHFPHIWSSSWFTWVQYNGSIMQPMVRNAGEALGVRALVNLTKPERPLFDSTVNLNGLYGIEKDISGPTHPLVARKFTGLASPAWPVAIFGGIDPVRQAKGAVLYKELCQGCHLPAPNTDAFWTSDRWRRIDNKGQRYLDLKQIALAEIGTDPEQAAGMASRKIILPDSFRTLPGDQKFTNDGFGPALGQLVHNVASRWYATQAPPVPPAMQDAMNGGRPNYLQVPLQYKARPLNGIWATPPYLHNASVPNLYALLSPVSERPTQINLGDREFDPMKVGYRGAAISGGFVLDTTKPGNHNTGHEFRDAPLGNGVIGRGLTPDERYALIEYLKSL